MHQEDVGIPRLICLALTYIEVSKYLIPDPLFHTTNLRNLEKCTNSNYICTLTKNGEIAHLVERLQVPKTFGKEVKGLNRIKVLKILTRGISSFGRALAWHARGDRFDSGILHALKPPSGGFCI